MQSRTKARDLRACPRGGAEFSPCGGGGLEESQRALCSVRHLAGPSGCVSSPSPSFFPGAWVPSLKRWPSRNRGKFHPSKEGLDAGSAEKQELAHGRVAHLPAEGLPVHVSARVGLCQYPSVCVCVPLCVPVSASVRVPEGLMGPTFRPSLHVYINFTCDTARAGGLPARRQSGPEARLSSSPGWFPLL